MDANEALLLSTIGVSSVFGLFAYLMVVHATSRPGAADGTGDGGSGSTGTGGVPTPPKPRFTEVDATSFGGRRDTQPSAYGGMVDPDKLGASLPARVTGKRTLTCIYKGKSVSGIPIVDVGPWNTADDYWDNPRRPASEAQHTNGTRAQNGRVPTNAAGIDLTPATWTALGWSGDPNQAQDFVDWDWDDYLAGTSTTTPPVTSAPWVTLGRTYNGLVWNGGPMPMQIVAWLDAVVAKFPEEAAYVQALKTAGKTDWWAWCGAYVRCMLAPFGIKGPISAAGLRGETTTADWAYVDAWLSWGTKVWGPEDGPIDNAQPQVGDVLVWKAPGIHHVSFYGKPLPDTDTFASLGGDQGKPLRVCEEELPMSWCVAIRRPPA